MRTSVQTLDKVIETLNLRKAKLNISWRKMALLQEYLGIPPGTLCSLAKGREPLNPHHRLILGLPAMKAAPVCVHCGEVHTTKRCVKRMIRWSDIPLSEMPVELVRWKLENRESMDTIDAM